MEISIGQMFHFLVRNNTLYCKTRSLSSLYHSPQAPKVQFVLKRPETSLKTNSVITLQLKSDPFKDFITDISGKALKLC